MSPKCLQMLTADEQHWLVLSSAGVFFQNQLSEKLFKEIPSECQTVCTQIRPDILSGLTWVQTVRKC